MLSLENFFFPKKKKNINESFQKKKKKTGSPYFFHIKILLQSMKIRHYTNQNLIKLQT